MRYNVVWNTFAAGIAREDFLYALHTLLCRFAQTYFGRSKTIRISIIANQSLSRSSLFFADLYRPTSVSRKLFVSQSAPTSLESHFTLFFADLRRPTLFSRKLSISQSTPTSLESHFTLFFADLHRPTSFSRKLFVSQSTPTSLDVLKLILGDTLSEAEELPNKH